VNLHQDTDVYSFQGLDANNPYLHSLKKTYKSKPAQRLSHSLQRLELKHTSQRKKELAAFVRKSGT